MVRSPHASAGDIKDKGSIPGLGRSPGGKNGNPLKYSCLENFMDRGGWWAIVHEVVEHWTRLSTHTHTHTHTYINNLSRILNASLRGLEEGQPDGVRGQTMVSSPDNAPEKAEGYR